MTMDNNELPEQERQVKENGEGFPASMKIILGVIAVLVILVIGGLMVFPRTRMAATPTPEPTLIATAGPATCVPVALMPTPSPAEQSLYPAVSEKDWVLGDASAEMTFIVYSDFQ